MPIFFICMLIFVAWLWYERNKHSRIVTRKTKEFWEREEEANHTRNKDISNLPYLHMNMEKIPGREHPHIPIATLWNQLNDMSHEPMLDLADYSNTDLKLHYGVGNFKVLTSYDDNYNNFLVQLSILGRTFSEIGDTNSAIACYEQVLADGSRKIQDFHALAKLYLGADRPEAVNELISQVSNDSSLERKDGILMKLRETLATYQ